MNLKLELLISTIDEGIYKVPNLLCNPLPYVSYLISWQHSTEQIASIGIPQEILNREDVKLVTLKGKGLSANRNNAITHATGDILLFSDDDTYYCETFFQTIIESFKEYSHADIITFRGEDKDGNLLRTYSKVPYEYKKRPKKSYVCSWEIAYRKGSDIPKFDCRFGLGSDFLACGEEEVFIHQASQKGLTIYFIPKTVVITNDNTTGKQFFTNPKVRYSKGAVLMLFYGYFPALLRIIKYAFIASKFNIGLSYSLFRDMYKGIQYIHKTNKRC